MKSLSRISFRTMPEDIAAMAQIRDHLRQSDPYADRTTIVRFALATAAAHVGVNAEEAART